MTSPNDFLPADYKAPRKIGDNSYMRYMRLRSALKVFSQLVEEFLPPNEKKLTIKNHLISIALLLGDAEQEEKEDIKQLSIPLDEKIPEGLKRGIDQAANGDLIDLGSFSQYAEMPLDESLNPDYNQLNFSGIYPYSLLPKDPKSSL